MKPRQEQLHEQITILATSWLRAQQVSPVRRTDEEAMRHYAKLSISLLEPYCTARGKRQLQAILNGEHDAEQLRVA